MVLLDLKMEFMDGFEVLKILRELNPNVPVIMITGHGSMEDVRKCLDCGAVDCLPKPYDFKRIVAKIRCIHNKSESADE